jgi:hypothetical protein
VLEQTSYENLKNAASDVEVDVIKIINKSKYIHALIHP